MSKCFYFMSFVTLPPELPMVQLSSELACIPLPSPTLSNYLKPTTQLNRSPFRLLNGCVLSYLPASACPVGAGSPLASLLGSTSPPAKTPPGPPTAPPTAAPAPTVPPLDAFIGAVDPCGTCACVALSMLRLARWRRSFSIICRSARSALMLRLAK